MPIRYTDLDPTLSGARDFVIRQRAPSVAHLVIIFLSALLICISVTLAVVNKLALIAILFILLGAIGLYVIVQIQRNRDLLLTTEFQNALFASALGINNKFCLIIKRDGNIIYLDRSFQELFPDFLALPRRTVDVLLERGRVAREDSEKIFSSIERGVYDKVIFNLRDSRGQNHRIIMSIEPIMRPSGFILLRGREYIERRGAEEGPPSDGPALNKSSITLFSHVMDTMNMGVYMTGPTGEIVYANPVLEQWLGYEDNEITSSNLSLPDIIHQTVDKSAALEPANFEGETMLKKRVGGMLTVFINQKIIRDDQGKAIGCTALVHNLIGGMSADVKKSFGNG